MFSFYLHLLLLRLRRAIPMADHRDGPRFGESPSIFDYLDQPGLIPHTVHIGALCTRCQQSEVTNWNATSNTALCNPCTAHDRETRNDNRSTKRANKQSTSETPCTMCNQATVNILSDGNRTPLCESCSRKQDAMDKMQRDSPVVKSDCEHVGSKMDFSSISTSQRASVDNDTVTNRQGCENVDLSYFKTKVPKSLIGVPKKRSSHKDSDKSSRQRHH